MSVRLGFLGCGFMGQMVHLPNFLDSPGCEVVALADAREQLARRVAEKFHIGRVYHDHGALAEAEDIDAVVSITPETANASIALDLLKAGKHVFIEKPIATSAAVAREMAAAAERAGKILMVGYQKRFDPGVEEAREMLSDLRETGELGRITFVRVHCFGGDWVCGTLGRQIATDEPAPVTPAVWPDWLPEGERDSFYWYNNVYCHNLNLLRYLFGEPDRVHSAWLRGTSRLAILDYGTFPVSMEAGSLAAYRWDEHLLIAFERGTLEIATPPPLLRNVPARVRLYRNVQGAETVEPLAPHDWSFRREAEHFIDCIAKNRQPLSPAADAVADVALVEAVVRRGLEGPAAGQQG